MTPEKEKTMRTPFLQPGDEVSLPGVDRGIVISAQTIEAGAELQTWITIRVIDPENPEAPKKTVQVILHHIH